MRPLLEAATTLPMPFLILQMIALMLWRYARLSRVLFGVSAALLLAVSLPVTGKVLMQLLYASVPAADAGRPGRLAAIIVPTAGAYADSGGRWWPAQNTVHRTAAGLREQERYGVPLIIAGGRPGGLARAEADVIAEHYGVKGGENVIIETSARNSSETGQAVARLLGDIGQRRVLLVTSCSHYARMAASLRHFDLQVVRPATGCGQYALTGMGELVPGIRGYKLTREAVREYVAILWYLYSGRLSVGDLL